MDILPREGRISEQVPGSGVGERLGERLGRVDGEFRVEPKGPPVTSQLGSVPRLSGPRAPVAAHRTVRWVEGQSREGTERLSWVGAGSG